MRTPSSALTNRLILLVLSAGWLSPAVAEPVNIGILEIRGALSEQASPLAWLMGPDDPSTLSGVVGTIDTFTRNVSSKGLLIRLKDAPLTSTQTQELGAAISRARLAGKKVHVFSEAWGNTEFLLGSYAQESIAQTGGPVSLSGMHMEEMFLADTLAWAGLRADMVQVGDYKGAREQMGNNAPSKEWTANIDQLLDSLYANFRASLKQGRHMDDAKLDAAFKGAWLADGAAAVQFGLLDTHLDYADISKHFEQAYAGEVEFTELSARGKSPMDAANPFTLLNKLMQVPEHQAKRPTIAILHIDGTIIDGESQVGGLLGGAGSVGSRTIRQQIEELIDQDLIKGVVVRINSPGGSATASEVMWQGLKRLGTHKPVWVSVGDMAASGGYYCLVGGTRVYVNPSSIVGSIGVVGGKISMGDLYKKVKVNVVSRSRGPMSDLFRSDGTWTPDELALVKGKMTETYQQFTSRVTSGRPGIELGKTAEGRLFTGDKAVALMMADKVGGLHDAITDLAADLGLAQYDVMHFPGPKSIPEMLEETFGQYAAAPSLALDHLAAKGQLGAAALTAQELLGPAWPQMRQAITGVLELRREPVLLMTPSIIVVR